MRGLLFARPFYLFTLQQIGINIILATFIMGINQGLAWSVTQISSVDITKDEKRGFAVGLNEFSGYLGVAIGGILVSLYDFTITY